MRSFEKKDDVLVIHRDLNDLDIFVKDFLKVLSKYSKYLIVSGYVSISTGRARGTEDIDVLIPVLKKDKFLSFFNDLLKNDFWCYQSDSESSAFEYHNELQSIRFARKGQMYPNMELIPITSDKKAQWFEFAHPQKLKIQDFEFFAAPFEFEILYKEIRLGSQKDLEDAQHLRVLFEESLNKTFMKECERVIRE